MSLNKTLDRLFDEIRREAKRNPDFADRLDAVLRVHDSRRDVSDAVIEDVAKDEAPAPKAKKSTAAAAGRQAPPTASVDASPTINPAGMFKREGEDALRTALETQQLSALRALVAEHNLDPSGVTSSLTHDELTAHILAQAKRRAERDDKMFDY